MAQVTVTREFLMLQLPINLLPRATIKSEIIMPKKLIVKLLLAIASVSLVCVRANDSWESCESNAENCLGEEEGGVFRSQHVSVSDIYEELKVRMTLTYTLPGPFFESF